MSIPYQAILVVSFGGPEKKEDVLPFLENVLRGRPVPRERMLEVAEHYYHFGGVSPINEQCRELIAALRKELDGNGIDLPIYWGNRNWDPMLTDTMREMMNDGIHRAIAFFTSAYSSYSGCRQYRENICASQAEIGPDAPQVDKIRSFYNHPDFIAANTALLKESINSLPESEQSEFHIAYTAHSIPNSMSDGCDYVKQLTETCRLVSEAAGIPEDRWKLVYQSRSGRPTDPWLEPDICDHIKEAHECGVRSMVISPVGFLSDHMEILFDLDEEAKQACDELGMTMVRCPSVGVHPTFVSMVRKLIQERIDPGCDKLSCGQFGPNHDVCPIDCCPAPRRPPARPAAAGGRPGGPPSGKP